MDIIKNLGTPLCSKKFKCLVTLQSRPCHLELQWALYLLTKEFIWIDLEGEFWTIMWDLRMSSPPTDHKYWEIKTCMLVSIHRATSCSALVPFLAITTAITDLQSMELNPCQWLSNLKAWDKAKKLKSSESTSNKWGLRTNNRMVTKKSTLTLSL